MQIVTVGGGSALLATLKTRQIDAFHLSAPTPYLAQREGFGEIIIKASAGDVPELTNFLYTRRALDERVHREVTTGRNGLHPRPRRNGGVSGSVCDARAGWP